ncbi:hypothetical protein SRHO_G00320210 [Serrasalmus rhombeus]
MTSRCPLAEIRIQQFNFIDIIYELVLLGVLRGARPPIFPRSRGFLSHLMAMLYSISTVTEHRMPTAEQCMFHVQIEMFLLLDDIFSLKEHVNADPWSLAATVWEHLPDAVSLPALDSVTSMDSNSQHALPMDYSDSAEHVTLRRSGSPCF